MATFRDTILQPLDNLRAIGGLFGLRVFVVTVHRRIWSGERVGSGAFIDIPTVLTDVAANGQIVNAHVRQVTRSEAIASGGVLTNRDLKVGPTTPLYPPALPTSGFDDTTIDPATVASATEVFWNVASPNASAGLPKGGAWFNKVGEEATSLHFYIFLRANGRRP